MQKTSCASSKKRSRSSSARTRAVTSRCAPTLATTSSVTSNPSTATPSTWPATLRRGWYTKLKNVSSPNARRVKRPGTSTPVCGSPVRYTRIETLEEALAGELGRGLADGSSHDGPVERAQVGASVRELHDVRRPSQDEDAGGELVERLREPHPLHVRQGAGGHLALQQLVALELKADQTREDPHPGDLVERDVLGVGIDAAEGPPDTPARVEDRDPHVAPPRRASSSRGNSPTWRRATGRRARPARPSRRPAVRATRAAGGPAPLAR